MSKFKFSTNKPNNRFKNFNFDNQEDDSMDDIEQNEQDGKVKIVSTANENAVDNKVDDNIDDNKVLATKQELLAMDKAADEANEKIQQARVKVTGLVYPEQEDQLIPLGQLQVAPDSWNFFPLPDDETIYIMARSIYFKGQRHPAEVWEQPDGTFMILSGHTRFYIIKKLHETYPDDERFNSMRCDIYGKDQIDSDTAQYLIVLANMEQRAKEAPSLRAKSIVRAMEAQKKATKVEWGTLGKKSSEVVATSFGIGSRTVERLYRYGTMLTQEALQLMDKNEITYKLADQLCKLPQELQTQLLYNGQYALFDAGASAADKLNLLSTCKSLEDVNELINRKKQFTVAGTNNLNYRLPKNYIKSTIAFDYKDRDMVKEALVNTVNGLTLSTPESKQALLDLLNNL